MKVQITQVDATPNNLQKAVALIVQGCSTISGSYELETDSKTYGCKVKVKFESAKKKEIKRLAKTLNGLAIVKDAVYESPGFWQERRRLIVRLRANQSVVNGLLQVYLASTEEFLDSRVPAPAELHSTRFVTPRA